MRHRLPLLLLLALAGLPLAAGAQVYKWTDANGTVHYADAPPAGGAKYQDVKVATHTTSAPDTPQTTTASRPDDKAAGGDGDATQPPSRVEDTPDNRKKLCDNLDANIKLLTSDRVVVTQDADGHEKAMSDDGREQQLAQARRQQAKFCAD